MNFQQHLERQLAFLSWSCHGYDLGITEEAVRIATSLRVLFHDTRSSTSLRTHLDLDDLRVISACETIPEEARFFANLTEFRIAQWATDVTWLPKLNRARTTRLIPVDDWWNQEVVYKFVEGTVSRRDLVLSAANRDGGAHVDPEVDRRMRKYLSLQHGGGWGLTHHSTDGETVDIPFRLAHWAALRQMGHEVLSTPHFAERTPVTPVFAEATTANSNVGTFGYTVSYA